MVAGWLQSHLPDQPDMRRPIQLFIVATDGSSPANSLLGPGTDSAYPAWSPDGRQIAFLGSKAVGSNGVYVADVGSAASSGGRVARHIGAGAGAGKPSGWLPAIDGTLASALSGPQWSPDGTELAVVNGGLPMPPDPAASSS